MNIQSKLKGNLAEAVIKGVLSHCQYRVMPFGVEETLREVAVLNKEDYKEVRLPDIMRSMPDYVIASLDMKSVRLVEVKYRANWSLKVRSSLEERLLPQVAGWGQILLVILFRRFLDEGPCIKCLPLQINSSDENFKSESYLEAITANGTKKWNVVEEEDFCELSDFFITMAIDPSEFKDALRAVVSAEEGLSSTTGGRKSTKSEHSPRAAGDVAQLHVTAAPTPQPAAPTPQPAAPTPRAAAPTPRAAAPTPRAATPTPRAAAPTPRAAAPAPRALPRPLRPTLPTLPASVPGPKKPSKP